MGITTKKNCPLERNELGHTSQAGSRVTHERTQIGETAAARGRIEPERSIHDGSPLNSKWFAVWGPKMTNLGWISHHIGDYEYHRFVKSCLTWSMCGMARIFGTVASTVPVRVRRQG